MYSGGRLQSQRVHVQRQETTYNKMDILFYDTVVSMKKHHNYIVFYHMLKAMIFIVFIPIDYGHIKGPNDDLILAAMIVALTVSLLQALALLVYRVFILRDNILLIRLCQEMNHSVEERIIGDVSQLQNCVSNTMYNRQNQTLISSQGLTQNMKNMYRNFLQSNLKEILAKETPCLSFFSNFTIFLGFCSMVYAIVALGVGNQNQPELILLIIYIVLEGFSKIVIILALLFVAIFPLLCCLGLMVVCCCSKWKGEAKLPDAEKATEEMILEADGTCSICYQNFIINEDVVRLKCSPKHMFHSLCISGWTKVKATCPICRASIQDGEQMQPVG